MYGILKYYKIFFKTIKGQNNSYITPENKSIIYHYLFIHSLLMILYDNNDNNEIINNKKVDNINKSISKLKKNIEVETKSFLNETDFYNLKSINKKNKIFYIKNNFLISRIIF